MYDSSDFIVKQIITNFFQVLLNLWGIAPENPHEALIYAFFFGRRKRRLRWIVCQNGNKFECLVKIKQSRVVFNSKIVLQGFLSYIIWRVRFHKKNV